MQAKKLSKTEIIKLAKLGHELQLENILLKDALQEAQTKNNEILMTFFDKQQELQRSQARERELHDIIDYKDSRIIDLEQAEVRERVLREALVTTCGAVEDLMAIGSEYGTSGYQVIVDEAREALKQEGQA